MSKRELGGLLLERVLAFVAGEDVSEAHSLLGRPDDLAGDRNGDPGLDDTVDARVRIGVTLPLSRKKSGTLSRECVLNVFEWWIFGKVSNTGTPVTWSAVKTGDGATREMPLIFSTSR